MTAQNSVHISGHFLMLVLQFEGKYIDHLLLMSTTFNKTIYFTQFNPFLYQDYVHIIILYCIVMHCKFALKSLTAPDSIMPTTFPSSIVLPQHSTSSIVLLQFYFLNSTSSIVFPQYSTSSNAFLFLLRCSLE